MEHETRRDTGTLLVPLAMRVMEEEYETAARLIDLGGRLHRRAAGVGHLIEGETVAETAHTVAPHQEL